MRKVLVVAGTMHIGGIENQLMHLLQNADRNQYQIDFTSTMKNPYHKKEIEQYGGKCFYIPEFRKRNPFSYCGSLFRILKNEQYEVVHANGIDFCGVVLLVALLAGVKIRIAHSHGMSNKTDGNSVSSLGRRMIYGLMRILARLCSTTRLACSTPAGEYLFGKNGFNSNFTVISNSVDVQRFIGGYEKVETGEFCDGWINVLHVGRVTPVKNQMFLTEIAELFQNQGKKIRILYAGNGDLEYEKKVRDIIKAKNLHDYIRPLNTRDDIDVLMRKSRAFVLPSVSEGMPLVVIEAQASGLPCIVADTFSHEVDFGIGRIKWMDPKAGASEWADAIEKASVYGRADKSQVIEMVNEKGFDSRLFAMRICDFYNES